LVANMLFLVPQQLCKLKKNELAFQLKLSTLFAMICNKIVPEML